MKTVFIVFIFIAIRVQAENIKTSSLPPFNVEKELKKIASACITSREHEEIAGNSFRFHIALHINGVLINRSVQLIAHQEMRHVLGFAPPGPFRHWNTSEWVGVELPSNATVEQYYELKEPRSPELSLDNEFLYERNYPPAINFFDRRFPGIRAIFRHEFEEILRQNSNVVDRKVVDQMISDYKQHIGPKVDRAVQDLDNRSNLCSDRYF